MNSRPIASVSAVLNGLSAGVGVTQSVVSLEQGLPFVFVVRVL